MNRSLFRYYGGKWRLAPWIISNFPEHRTYIEPFAGAASVFFQKPRAYSECLNDINGEIVLLFRVLQAPKLKQRLIQKLQMTPYSREEYDLAHTPSQNPIEICRRLIIRSMMGFHADSVIPGNSKSGFRNDLDREYTISAHQWVSYPEYIHHFANRLQGVVIEHTDAFKLFKKWQKKPYLWYVDPPYMHNTRTAPGKHQYIQEMTDSDHERLLKTLEGLSGMVILSGYESDLYSQLEKKGWSKLSKEYRNNTFQSGSRVECLWLNHAAQDAKFFPNQSLL